MCYKGKYNARIIEVNHRSNELRAMARELLTSGGRVSLDGVAARGLVNGRGPRRSRGRDGVGTCSDGTRPNLPYRHCRHIHIIREEATKSLISRLLFCICIADVHGSVGAHKCKCFYCITGSVENKRKFFFLLRFPFAQHIIHLVSF